MIDWTEVLENSVWLAGLATMLATFGFASLPRSSGSSTGGGVTVLRATWTRWASTDWTRLGALLFCVGMALTSQSWPEEAGWAFLGVYPVYSWATGVWRRFKSRKEHKARDTTREHLAAPDGYLSDADTAPLDPRDQVVSEMAESPPYDPEAFLEAQRASISAAARSALKCGAEWVVRLELILLLLVSPVFLFPRVGSPSLLALAVLPYIWLNRWVARGHFIPRTPLDWPICLVLTMVLVSTVTVFDLSYSLARITVLLFSIGSFYAVVDWATPGALFGQAKVASPGQAGDTTGDASVSTSRARAGWALGSFFVLGMLFGLLGLFAVNWVRLLGQGWADKLFPALGQLRAEIPILVRGLPDTSRWLHPSEVGGALLWVVPLELAVTGWCWGARFGRPVWRWVVRLAALPMAAVTLAVVASTQTRGVFVAMAIAIAFTVWMLSNKWLRLAWVALVLAGAAAVLYVGPQRIVDSISPGASGNFGFGLSLVDSERSLGSREIIWSRALYAIEDFPFTGVGLDTFRFVMPTLYPTGDSMDKNTSHPHDQLLGAALELGLPGFVGFLALWFSAAAMAAQAWRSARRSGDRWGRAAAAGAAASLLGYFVYGLTDVVSIGDRPGLLFWLLLALLVVIWRLTRLPSRPGDSASLFACAAQVSAGTESVPTSLSPSPAQD